MSDEKPMGSAEEKGPLFEFRHIHISLATGQQEVIALVIGPLAVCQAQSGEWRLTHVATGYRVVSFEWWDDCCNAAARLAHLDWTHAGETEHPDHAAIGKAYLKTREGQER